ncbi:MAG TPA: NAD(P)-dependent oxidoreductase [Terriglobia bacterium]|nr:NAD(P)-dependent oxidoreductase [Terriglobia bacterium]
MDGMHTIGFVGVGNMGWPMAARLVRAGYPVHVLDSRLERAAAFAKEIGGHAAKSIKELGAVADIIITMLPDSDAVGAVLFGTTDTGASNLRSGSVVIEMSSGVPNRTIAFAERLRARGVGMIDAPVSGGVKRAVTGELAIMAGGDSALIDRCEPVLRCMGSVIMRIGALGAGQAMKALNNLVSAGGFLIGIEALLIGKKFGLDPELMVDVLNASTGMNNSTQKKFKQFVISRSFDSGFGLDLMVKDLTIALEMARDEKANSPFAALCREIWASAATTLGPGQDHTALAKLSEMLAGAQLGGS